MRHICELRAEGLGLGKVMHEGLGLEQGLGLGLGNTYGLGLGLQVKIVRSRVGGLGFGKVTHEGLGLEKGLKTGNMTGETEKTFESQRQKKRPRDSETKKMSGPRN